MSTRAEFLEVRFYHPGYLRNLTESTAMIHAAAITCSTTFPWAGLCW